MFSAVQYLIITNATRTILIFFLLVLIIGYWVKAIYEFVPDPDLEQCE